MKSLEHGLCETCRSLEQSRLGRGPHMTRACGRGRHMAAPTHVCMLRDSYAAGPQVYDIRVHTHGRTRRASSHRAMHRRHPTWPFWENRRFPAHVWKCCGGADNRAEVQVPHALQTLLRLLFHCHYFHQLPHLCIHRLHPFPKGCAVCVDESAAWSSASHYPPQKGCRE